MWGLTSTEATSGRVAIKFKMSTARTVQIRPCHYSGLALCALANESEYSLDHLSVCEGTDMPPTKACLQTRSCPQGKYNPEGRTIKTEPFGKWPSSTVTIALFLLVALLGLWALSMRSADLGSTQAGEAWKFRSDYPETFSPRSLSQHCGHPLCQACFPREEGRGKSSNVCWPAKEAQADESLLSRKLTYPCVPRSWVWTPKVTPVKRAAFCPWRFLHLLKLWVSHFSGRCLESHSTPTHACHLGLRFVC